MPGGRGKCSRVCYQASSPRGYQASPSGEHWVPVGAGLSQPRGTEAGCLSARHRCWGANGQAIWCPCGGGHASEARWSGTHQGCRVAPPEGLAWRLTGLPGNSAVTVAAPPPVRPRAPHWPRRPGPQQRSLLPNDQGYCC